MGLLDGIFSGSRTIRLGAPVGGRLVDLSRVSDATFAEKVLGDGVAIVPDEGTCRAPCDGRIERAFETGHAFTMTTTDGAELLIHIGFDTVRLGGRGFTVRAADGAGVERGDPIVEADLRAIAEAGLDTTVVMIVLGGASIERKKTAGHVGPGDEVLRLRRERRAIS